MNLLPRLLRTLAQAASDGDAPRFEDAWNEIKRNDGWQDRRDEFVKGLPDKERTFVANFLEARSPDVS